MDNNNEKIAEKSPIVQKTTRRDAIKRIAGLGLAAVGSGLGMACPAEAYRSCASITYDSIYTSNYTSGGYGSIYHRSYSSQVCYGTYNYYYGNYQYSCSYRYYSNQTTYHYGGYVSQYQSNYPSLYYSCGYIKTGKEGLPALLDLLLKE